MNKLSFRARALDATKPMPVYKANEIPDLPDFAAINRAVPQMPTGMEKEEETEHHLQRALSAQQVYGTAEALVIPVPDIKDIGASYRKIYGSSAGDYKPPKQYIHVQPWGMDQEIPDYDMDSEDEGWLNKQSKKLEVTPYKFETMLDRLEKGSGQTVMTLQEAKALLKEDDDLIIAVYDYWLNKRLRLQHPLIPSVKTEKRDGTTTSNPYVAFRRRTEKMQTRKNRKNDEASYERMLKLKRDLGKALTIIELLKRREKSKKEMLKLTIEISEKRYQMQDWDGKAYGEALAKRNTLPPTYIQPLLQQYGNWGQRDETTYVKKTSKREYKKRRHKQSNTAASNREPSVQLPQYSNDVDILGQNDMYSSEDDILSPQLSASDHEVEDDPDGQYAFRRKPGVVYHAPINNGFGNWPWHGREEGGFGESRYRYSLTSLSRPKRCVGYARRRIGRGGRMVLDRAATEFDDYIKEVDFRSATETGWGDDYQSYVRTNHIPHFRPKTPIDESDEPPSKKSYLDDGYSSYVDLELDLNSFHNQEQWQLPPLEVVPGDTLDLFGSVELEQCQSSPPMVVGDSLELSSFIGETVVMDTTQSTVVINQSSVSTSSNLSNHLQQHHSALSSSSGTSSRILDTHLPAEKSSPVVKPVAVQHNGPMAQSLLGSMAASSATSLITNISTKCVAPQASTVFNKIATTVASVRKDSKALDSKSSEHGDNHEKTNNLLKDKVLAMEVT